MNTNQEKAALAAIKRLPAMIKEDGGTPVYLQISTVLKNWITQGAAEIGAMLPPERLMCEHFRVSRMTLREAYDILEREGLIERKRGSGTFVAPPRMRKQQQEMRSFTEELMKRGVVPSSKVLRFERQRASAEAATFFGIPHEEFVYRIERLRSGDGKPLALEAVEIPAYLCPGLEKFDLAKESLYLTLEREYGLDLAHCVEEVSAELANRNHKSLLGLPGAAAVLVIRRKAYSSNETPVEMAVTVYRADQYRAVIHAARLR
jgi:GntR family transcriptional regulator